MSHPPTNPTSADKSTPSRMGANRQYSHLNSARASIRQALSWYSRTRRHSQPSPDIKQQAALQAQLERLTATLEKLDQGYFRIAVFGLVSRGKSAVVNALVGQKILPTGPLNGVTQWPRSVQWTVELPQRWIPPNLPLTRGGQDETKGMQELPPNKRGIPSVLVELIDTPGLDEVAGEARSEMARDVARQADLILFVVAGDITRTEYQALCDLWQTQKPLILVFNKIDLYPEQDRQAIYQQLQQLGASQASGKRQAVSEEDSEVLPSESLLSDRLSPNEIVMVAADPKPLRVRVEWPDGLISQEWERPAPQVDELKQKILTILAEEGRSLLAINALVQARDAEAKIASGCIESRQMQAENLIWRFAQYKSVAVALNPIAFLDLVGATVADLALIRALARLYGLPMTGYEAGKLWQQILFSGSGLVLSELLSGLFLGLGKSAAAVAGATGDGSSITAYAGAAIAQATMAGYGTYKVGQAAQVYLEQGCTWGPLGPNTVIEDILARVEPNTVLYRLRQELQEKLAKK